MHTAALDHIGVAGTYSARDVDLAAFHAGIAELRSGELDGANVTMPYKRRAYEMCDETTEQGERVGAVNTLLLRRSSLVGENTDVAGILTAWELRRLPDGGPVIILGAGGAAAAALVALAGRPQYVVARRPERAHQLTRRIGTGAVVTVWGEPVPPGVVVNATSIGMGGEPLPDFLLESATGLFDMPYGATSTPAVTTVRRRSFPVADGLDMLVGQAVASFAAWTGVDVPEAVFRRAAAEELERRLG
jgi:shikimate dehydrogenase